MESRSAIRRCQSSRATVITGAAGASVSARRLGGRNPRRDRLTARPARPRTLPAKSRGAVIRQKIVVARPRGLLFLPNMLIARSREALILPNVIVTRSPGTLFLANVMIKRSRDVVFLPREGHCNDCEGCLGRISWKNVPRNQWIPAKLDMVIVRDHVIFQKQDSERSRDDVIPQK